MRRTLELVAVLSIIASANAMLTNRDDARNTNHYVNYPSSIPLLIWQ